MPDKKLTDSEIIKALECCMDEMGCIKGCPCFDPKAKGSHCKIAKENEKEKLTLDLINRLQAENERLTTLAELGNTRANDYRVMRDRALKAEAENEDLRYKVKDFEKIRRAYQRFIHENMPYIQNSIDNLLKELVSEDNA